MAARPREAHLHGVNAKAYRPDRYFTPNTMFYLYSPFIDPKPVETVETVETVDNPFTLKSWSCCVAISHSRWSTNKGRSYSPHCNIC